MDLLKYNTKKKYMNVLKANNLTIKNGYLTPVPTFKLTNKSIILILSVATLLNTNLLIAYLNNLNPAAGNNFNPEYVISDQNNNDIIFDENGQVVTETITPSEKVYIIEKFNNELLKDISNRSLEKISTIDKIISITQLPYNLCEDDNEYDKYQTSIIFKANNKTYCLNYLSGDKFKIQTNSIKDSIFEFANYLSTCSLDLIYVMSETEKNILSTLGKNYSFVSPAYYAYGQSGDLYYYVPVYGNNNSPSLVELYSCLANSIDAYNLNPNNTLLSQLNTGKGPFSKTTIAQNNDCLSILEIYTNFSNLINSSQEK